ncbi:uncharacterized protein LOC130688712 [Daphnia carinata]|uniref:uncharacterized protein LOC130688712 n=1 Tax=Daphnia carinata TaxID=120202 RepID=UPI00257AD1AF|nr:uncharacterized protein LOC130688712 [Daphnia carinata]XP_057367705.1 uncharacterized protein LOC130688712 [Daphnia carinata]
MEKFNDKLSEEDEEFVLCQICCLNFDEEEHVPKYLKCHHFFCLSCIKRLTGPNESMISCPTCRTQSILSPKKCEELFTNRIALRLSKVVEGVQEKAEKEAKQQQQWCSVCAFPACDGCRESQHPIQDSTQFCNTRMLLLKSIIDKTNYLCNEALVDCHKIMSAHQVILQWIKWLQLEIVQSAAKNTATIAQLESLITDETWTHIPQEANMNATINNINQLIAKCADRCQMAEKAEAESHNFLRAYCSAHQESAKFFEPELFSSDGSPPDLVSWLKRLNTFEEGITLNQANKRCVNVLAFLISLLSGEQLPTDASSLNCVFTSNDVDTNAKNIATENYYADITNEPRPSCSGTHRLAKRFDEDDSESIAHGCKREWGSVLQKTENVWSMNNSTKQDDNAYRSLGGMDAQQEPGGAQLIMSTYNNLVHESVALPYGTAGAGAAVMHDIQHEEGMEIQEVFHSRTPRRSQIYGSNKAENPLQQGYRTGMQIRKAPEARLARRPSPTLPLSLARNSVAPAAAITNNGTWTGGDNPEIIEIRTVNPSNWPLNNPPR